jgi:hypothetical protein
MNDQFLTMLVDETLKPAAHSSGGFEVRRHLSRWPVVCWEGTKLNSELIRFMIGGSPWDVPLATLVTTGAARAPFLSVVSHVTGREVNQLFYARGQDGSPLLVLWDKRDAPELQRELEHFFSHLDGLAA